MYKLIYSLNNKEINSFVLPSKAICYWKKKQLVNLGSYNMGKFTIEKV